MSDRFDRLIALRDDLEKLMEAADAREYPPLARQYRETLREIDEIEGGFDGDDEIAAIILRNRKPAPDRVRDT